MKKVSSVWKNPRSRGTRLPVLAEALEVRRLLAANLVISELMANNNHSITDSYGDHEDWIEIHNAGDAAANLHNYFLTDDKGNPEKWRFPIQTLAAGSYLVVFASGLDQAIAGQELHTNFSLSSDGEYLGLIRAADDTVQFAYDPIYPAQSADVSYGLSDADDPSSARLFFPVASPSAANFPTAGQPVFSISGKTFSSPFSLALSTTTIGGQIRYTTDGTVPTLASTLYIGPLNIATTAVVRAATFAAGYTASLTTSQSYIYLDSSVATFSSNIPIVVIDTHGQSLNDTADTPSSAVFINTNDSTGIAGALDTPDFDGRIGIHIRGSTSESYAKKQYAVEVWDENNDGEKASLLGEPADSDWILYAPYTEKSLMQNDLAMKWAAETGHYASRTQFVEVYLNSDGGSAINYNSDYIGVYILMEKIKVSSDRVDITKLKDSDNSGDDLTGGYLFKKDRADPGETTFTTTLQSQTFVMDDPDSDSLTPAQLSYLTGYMNDFETALFSPNFADPINGYAKYIDVDSFVDYYLLNEMTRNIDAFWLSTYYYKDRDGKIEAGPVWDFNQSLGASNAGSSANSDGWDTDVLTQARDPYFQRLLQDPNFQQKVSDRWNQLRAGVFSTANLMADINNDVAILSDNNGNYPVGNNPAQPSNNPVVRNFKRWNVLEASVTVDGLYDVQGRWIQDVQLMKNWLTARVNWIDSQFIPTPIITAGGDFGAATSVSISPVGPAVLTDTEILGPHAPLQYIVPSGEIPGWQSPDFIPVGWLTGIAGIGYDTVTTTGVNYTPYISTNVQSLMQNVNPSIFTRFNFTVIDPADIQALILKVQFDDGFIAWVNGVRVMDGHSPQNAVPYYNNIAPGWVDDTKAIVYQEFDITAVKDLLVPGVNVLAIQGLNAAIWDEDFLLSPTLYARTYSYPAGGTVYYTTDGSDPRTTTGAISATAHAYSAALSLVTDTEIKARTYSSGVWGGIADEIYTFGKNSLRITELMFNPPAGAGFSTQEFEYVELQNVSSSPLNLSGYAFTNGISFTFPNITLDAGAYGVVVKNPDAFHSRYGYSENILGIYSGSFDNSGEKVELSNGFGQVTESFKYQPWYGNGDGRSMVVINPSGDISALATAAGWRASDTVDGQPGYADSDAIVPAVVSWSIDDGGAGQPSIQLALNTSLTVASSASFVLTNELTGQIIGVSGHSIDGSVLTLTLPTNLASGAYEFSLAAGALLNASGIASPLGAAGSFLLIRAGQVWSAAGQDVIVQRLEIGIGGRADLATGSLLLDYTGANLAETVRGLLFSGEIFSSAAGSNHAVGYAEASALGLTTFASQTLDSTALLLKYSLLGDANLDGQIDADDYALLDRGMAKHLTGWTAGDFNYDGSVTPADAALLDRSAAGVEESAVIVLPPTTLLSSISIPEMPNPVAVMKPSVFAAVLKKIQPAITPAKAKPVVKIHVKPVPAPKPKAKPKTVRKVPASRVTKPVPKPVAKAKPARRNVFSVTKIKIAY